MITLVEALNYRCLRYVWRPLGPFHVLVGPNASGKTTFLDVIGFLRDIVADGFDDAVEGRARNPMDLLFRHQGDGLQLAVEAKVPDELKPTTFDTVRYQVSLTRDETARRFEFEAETLLLKESGGHEGIPQRSLFPRQLEPPGSILVSDKKSNNKVLLNKVYRGNDNFYNDGPQARKGWAPSFRLGPRKSALGNLPADEKSFPTATWFREYLATGVQRFVLNSRAIKNPSPPARVAGFLTDGSNLPWVVARLRRNDKAAHKSWIRHLRTALPDLVDIATVERPEDRHCYMTYTYAGGLTVPSWMVSDGILRLTALTLPAYLKGLGGIFLIEEPENGIHPGAVSTVYDSLSSVYDAQMLLATHSPVFLNEAGVDQVLCFTRDDSGATDVVLGSEHPNFREWKNTADLGTLLASGALG